jgi:hypothetical protein
MLLIEVYSG